VNAIDMSHIRRIDRSRGARDRARAVEAWREAELQVQAQWDAYLAADRGSAGLAFAAYVAALDAEAATAVALAHTFDPAAAAA
jgi:hypothetical protein